MSKREKLMARLARKPAPVDFRWSELVTLAEQLQFTPSCISGSHYIFQHIGGLTFTMSRTHPSGLLKPYQIKAALDAFTKVSPPNHEPDH